MIENLTEVGTYRPGGFKYVPLDESKVVNKSEPEMSDEEFEEAIRKMATEDANDTYNAVKNPPEEQ